MDIRKFVRPEQLRELTLFLIIVVIVIFFGSQIENFYNARTFNRISTSVAVIIVVAVGETLVVLTRNIDLSVGSIVGFTAYFVGQQVSNHEIAPALAILLAIGVGAGLGLINGILITYGNIPAIVTTLGTLAIYRGILVEYANAETVTTQMLPDWIDTLPQKSVFTVIGLDIRYIVAVAIAVVIIFQLLILFSHFGRRLYAIGSNPDAAVISGIPSRRLVTTAYVLCGALSGLAGFLYLARQGTITIVAAQGLELQVVAAVVVGGVNIFGGSGTMLGAMLGAVLIATLEQGLIRMQINEFWKDALQGVFILIAVIVDAVLLERVRRFWVRGELKMRASEQEEQRSASHA